MKTGRLIPNGVKLEPHEYDTVLFFTNLGKTIELIKPPATQLTKVADFIMDGLIWEAKSPTVNTHKATERLFYRAASQSPNIIIDLRRIKGHASIPISTLKACFTTSRKVRKMLIINKKEELITFKK